MSQELNKRLIEQTCEIIKLKEQQRELVEALKNLLAVHQGEGGTKYHACDIANAAIAKAEGTA